MNAMKIYTQNTNKSWSSAEFETSAKTHDFILEPKSAPWEIIAHEEESMLLEKIIKHAKERQSDLGHIYDMKLSKEEFELLGGEFGFPSGIFPSGIKELLILHENQFIKCEMFSISHGWEQSGRKFYLSINAQAVEALRLKIEFSRKASATFVLSGGTKYPNGTTRGRVEVALAPAMAKGRIRSSEYDTVYFNLSPEAAQEVEAYVATPTERDQTGWHDRGGNQLPALVDHRFTYPQLYKEVMAAWNSLS